MEKFCFNKNSLKYNIQIIRIGELTFTFLKYLFQNFSFVNPKNIISNQEIDKN